AAYDQMLHPQKRFLVKDVLSAVLARLLELEHKIVELEMSDFNNFGDILLDLKLVPDDLNLKIPKFFGEEMSKQTQLRRAILETLNAKQLGFGESGSIFPEMKREEAVQIIQIAERGRQGKLRAKYMRDI
ncbi:Dynein regulatory complex protein 11, partial [Nowakowskiella sp. JEL0078]